MATYFVDHRCSLRRVSNRQSAPSSRLLLPQEPTPNLSELKTRLITYHNCTGNHGCYTSDLDRQSDLAIAILRRRAARANHSDKLGLVPGIDETALSNWDEEMQDDFGCIARDSNGWLDKKQATAIAGTLRLCKEAVAHGVSVFFITGRAGRYETRPRKPEIGRLRSMDRTGVAWATYTRAIGRRI